MCSLISQCVFQSHSAGFCVCGPKPTQPLQPGVAPCLAATLVVKYTRRCPDGPWSCCVTIVAFRLVIPKKSSHFLHLTDHESFFRWDAVQRSRFLDPIFRENDVFIGALPTQAPSLIQIACWHGCVLVHQSFSECGNTWLVYAFQKHAQTQFSRRFLLEISSSTMLRVESTTLTRCCRLVVFLAEDSQVTTTLHDRHHWSLDSNFQSCLDSGDLLSDHVSPVFA